MLIGCDPEIFLLQSGKFKSVIGLIGGDKWNPIQISEVGHAILEDNVAVEFNIPACDSLEAFKKEIKFTMEKIKEKLPNFDFSTESATFFPEEELTDPKAWVFGCEPDFNAWTNDVNPKPRAPNPTLRSCGGHVHVGSDIAISNPIGVVRAMDLFLGVPSTILDKSGELRRKLYGGAGAHRIKKYGVEYRTLSNFWIFNGDLIDFVYRGTGKALEFVEKGNKIPEEDGILIQDCINNGNMKAYEHLVNSYGLL